MDDHPDHTIYHTKPSPYQNGCFPKHFCSRRPLASLLSLSSFNVPEASGQRIPTRKSSAACAKFPPGHAHWLPFSLLPANGCCGHVHNSMSLHVTTAAAPLPSGTHWDPHGALHQHMGLPPSPPRQPPKMSRPAPGRPISRSGRVFQSAESPPPP